MRAFTDDDLKRLKDDLCWTEEEIITLIARLEAAERFIDHSFMPVEWEDHPDYKAWRKAAGL